MSKHVQVELKADERTELEQLIHKGTASARELTRARILLLSDRSQGQRRTEQEVAEAVLCSPSTVGNIRRRYAAGGVAQALKDKGWPGAKPKLTGEIEAQLTLLACSEPPKGHTRWSLRLLAGRLVELECLDEVSHVTVGEWLKKTTCSRGG
jgi:transposase